MRVRRRDHDPVGGDSGFLIRHLLDSVADRRGNHAAINDHDGELLMIVFEHDGAGMQRIGDSAGHRL